MSEKKGLTTEETFALAVQNHQKNNLQTAENLYKETINRNPHHVDALNNLGVILKNSGKHQKAKSCFEKAIEIKPDYINAYSNLGLVYKEIGELQKAKSCFEKAIEINTYHAENYNNLGAVYNNLGVVFGDLGELKKSKTCTEKAIEINPNYLDAYWNLHSFSSDIDEALATLKKLYQIENKYIKAKIMISALEGFKGNFDEFNHLTTLPESNHPYTSSIKWIFSLPKLPKIFFNRWNLYDAVIKLAEKTRPFYEFGVWNGISFKYLINNFKEGFGFDTFTGLPESWHDLSKGTYSSFGLVPKISGGKFIVGKFEDTLPKFFSKIRPMASLINFDADLYSSTLCALNYSNKVIDEKTILIFDEFIMNNNWEKDEYKALKEFCNNFKIDYEVIAVSFFSKQVAIKLKKY